MTKNQFKKKISSYTHDELVAFLLSTFDSSKAFRDAVAVVLDPAEKEKLVNKCRKKLDKAFSPYTFSLSACKAIVKEFESLCPDEGAVAGMWLYYAAQAAELSSDFGDFGSSFYDSIYNAGMKAVTYAEEHPEHAGEILDDIESLIRKCGGFGYGVQGDLQRAFDNLINKLCDEGFIEAD